MAINAIKRASIPMETPMVRLAPQNTSNSFSSLAASGVLMYSMSQNGLNALKNAVLDTGLCCLRVNEGYRQLAIWGKVGPFPGFLILFARACANNVIAKSFAVPADSANRPD